MKEIRIDEIKDEWFRKQFNYLECCLSPENLYCDGEVSEAYAMASYNRIMNEWHELEMKLGCKVVA